MKKISLDKILEVLAKYVDESVIDEVKADLEADAPVEEETETEVEETSDEPVEETSVEGEGESAPVEEPSPVEDEVPPAEPVGDVPPVEEEVAPEGEVPPVDPALPEGTSEVNPMVPPAEAEPESPISAEPPVPEFDAESKIAEQEKTIEALKDRIESLEHALKEGGILSEEEGAEVGVDDPTRLGDSRDDEEVMEDLLTRINSGQSY